jgi:hypothetical protein
MGRPYDADGGYRMSALVSDRRGDSAHADFVFLVIYCVAARADCDELFFQRRRVGYGLRESSRLIEKWQAVLTPV